MILHQFKFIVSHLMDKLLLIIQKKNSQKKKNPLSEPKNNSVLRFSVRGCLSECCLRASSAAPSIRNYDEGMRSTSDRGDFSFGWVFSEHSKESNQRNSPWFAHTACVFVAHDRFGRCGTRLQTMQAQTVLAENSSQINCSAVSERRASSFGYFSLDEQKN